jgi:hypothetical protein
VFFEVDDEFFFIVIQECGDEFLHFISSAVHDRGLDLPVWLGFLDEEDALWLCDC